MIDEKRRELGEDAFRTAMELPDADFRGSGSNGTMVRGMGGNRIFLDMLRHNALQPGRHHGLSEQSRNGTHIMGGLAWGLDKVLIKGSGGQDFSDSE
jgi:hypothetical protein